MKNINPFARFILISILGVVILFSFFKFDSWPSDIGGGDSWGYYSYLPATFIHHDHGNYNKTVKATQLYNPGFPNPLDDVYGLYHQHPVTKNNVIKYTSGVAIMLLPAFIISHFIISQVGHINNGFTSEYSLGVGLGVILWMLIGAYFLLTLLCRYFSFLVSASTVVALVLATNVYYNSVLNPIMSHALLFSLHSILLYCIDNYYKKPNAKLMLVAGFVIGLILLTRLTEIYCLFIFLLYGVSNKLELINRMSLVKENLKHIFILIFCIAFVFVPQIIYWKSTTGHYFFNGYIGENFDFKHPHILKGLFSFNNGWLPWTPIMLFSIMGILLSKQNINKVFWSTVILLPIYLFITYSWWCFNYINGFGSRPMEHLYPLLAFAFANFLLVIFKHNKLFKIVFFALLFFAICLNIFQNYQMNNGLMYTEGSTLASYFHMFGKTKNSHEAMATRCIDQIQPIKVKYIKNLINLDFEGNVSLGLKDSGHGYLSKSSLFISNQSLTIDTIKLNDVSNAKYIKVSADIFIKDSSKQVNAMWKTPFLYLKYYDKHFLPIEGEFGVWPFQWCGNETFNILSTGKVNTWGKPFYYSQFGVAKYCTINIWNGEQLPFYLDNLNLSLCK